MSRRRWGLDLTPLRTSRDFRLVFTAGFISAFGSFIAYVAIPYQVATLTHSPLLVGLLGLCELAPLLITAPLGGSLADYLDRRRLVLTGELAFALVSLVALINAVQARPAVWLLYVVAGLSTAVDGLSRPALEALVPRLVSPQEIPATNALQTLRGQFGQLAGPGLAGLILAGAGPAWAYGVDLGTYLISFCLLLWVRTVPPPPDTPPPSLRSIGSGLRYAVRRPELFGTYLVDINAMFFGMPEALFPFVAMRLGGPAVLGLLYAAPSAGALLATLTSGWTARVHRHGLAVLLAACAWGAAIVGFGLANSLWLALLGLVAAGASDMVSGLFRMTIWNQTIPDHVRGRLAGVEMLSYSIGPTLGNAESGLAAALLGVRAAVVSGGVACVAGTALLATVLPAFRRYNGRDGLARKVAEDQAWLAGARTTA